MSRYLIEEKKTPVESGIKVTVSANRAGPIMVEYGTPFPELNKVVRIEIGGIVVDETTDARKKYMGWVWPTAELRIYAPATALALYSITFNSNGT